MKHTKSKSAGNANPSHPEREIGRKGKKRGEKRRIRELLKKTTC